MAARRHPPSDAPIDVASALIGVMAPGMEPVEAGFFHRTLARWLGLPEGRAPSNKVTPVEWSYAFWKAELLRTWASAQDDQGSRQIWSATVFVAGSDDATTYEYWIDLDRHARIRRSGWITQAPDLLSETARPEAKTIDQPALARLFADDSENER